MKLYVVLFITCCSVPLFAQWQYPGNDARFDGNVGIGLAPTYKLHVQGSGTFHQDQNGITGLNVVNDDVTSSASRARVFARNGTAKGSLQAIGSGTGGVYIGSESNHDVFFRTNSLNKMTILTNGNVGIGTVGPGSLLHLKGGAPFLQVEGVSTGGSAGINLINDSGTSGLSLISYGSTYAGSSGYNRANGASLHTTAGIAGSAGIAIAARNTTGYITFHSGGDAERMRITSNGKVGINTGSPNEMLEIKSTQPSIRVGDARDVSTFGSAFTEMSSLKFYHHYNTLIGAKIYTTKKYSAMSWGGTDLRFAVSNVSNNSVADAMTITYLGNVGIGTTTPDAKLAVNGDIHATEVRVTATVPGPDYVFEKYYNLPTLEEIKAYIDEHKHLPEVPSAKEMEEKGINVGEMNMILLKKVEELTLHLIEKEKRINDLEGKLSQVDRMMDEIAAIKKILSETNK